MAGVVDKAGRPISPKGMARPSIQGLPRREFYSGAVHYAAPFGKPGTFCGVDGHVKLQARQKQQVNCGKCMEMVEWVWSHRKGSKRTS